jgi:hypothetical protein
MTEYTAEYLVKMIRNHYVVNDGAYNRNVILEQVPDGTGMFQSRWIDAVVFQMFPSKGLTRFAFEVKIARSDFLQELSHPEKHLWCKECFHEFWFVAPKDVIQLAELPPNIGWMYPAGGKLHRARHAVRNPNPKLDDTLLAGFMRAAGKAIDNAYQLNKDEILKNDNGYKQAKEYEDAVVTFCRSRGDNSFLDKIDKDEIIRHLAEATMDKQLKQDRDKLLSVTAKFQRDILSLLPLFVAIARRNLLARDELGKYIIGEYGGTDNESIEALKEYAKSKEAYASQKQIAELIEALLAKAAQP